MFDFVTRTRVSAPPNPVITAQGTGAFLGCDESTAPAASVAMARRPGSHPGPRSRVDGEAPRAALMPATMATTTAAPKSGRLMASPPGHDHPHPGQVGNAGVGGGNITIAVRRHTRGREVRAGRRERV